MRKYDLKNDGSWLPLVLHRSAAAAAHQHGDCWCLDHHLSQVHSGSRTKPWMRMTGMIVQTVSRCEGERETDREREREAKETNIATNDVERGREGASDPKVAGCRPRIWLIGGVDVIRQV